MKTIKEMNTKYIQSKEVLKQIVQLFASITKRVWHKYSKVVNITKHSKK